jgi:acyl carrier protein
MPDDLEVEVRIMRSDIEPEHIASVVKNFLFERFDIPVDRLTDESSLRDLGLDSILMLDIMLEVEDRLGIKLRDLSMPSNPKFKDVIALIKRNMAISG